jgi:LemA protein
MNLIPYLAAGFGIVGALIYLATIYNGLVGLRNDIDKAWSNIDVLLKQRYDELPRLIEVCKGYMQYESKTLQALMEARARYTLANTVAQKGTAGGNLTGSVNDLFAVAEHYPQLKANESFLEVQQRITELESQIADRREYYNDAINLFNTRIQEMPDKIVAGAMGLRPRAMFPVSAKERQAVSATLTASRA